MTSFAECCEGVRYITDSRLPSGTEKYSGLTVTKWLILLRGAKTVVAETDKWVRTGPMAPLITPRGVDGYERKIGAVDEDVTIYLDRVSAAFVEYSEPEVSKICIAAVELLRKSWVGIASGCDFGVAFFWAVLVEAEFMVLLELKRPEALLVLAAYCVLLHSGNWQWWLKGWPKHMLRMIEGMMEERWKGWLEWPVQVIGNEDTGQWKERALVVTEGVCCQ